MSRVAGALIGAVPGLLLWAIGLIVTGGGDGMILFGMGGVVLTLLGFIVGYVWGSTANTWPSRNRVPGLIAGLATVVLLVGGLVGLGGPPDPILDARDCFEIYELLGATGQQGELAELPDLTEEQIDNAYASVEHDPSDPICAKLKEDLDALTNP